MNLGIFNRVNSKESESGGMYSEWASLSRLVRSETCENDSVLSKFPAEVGRDVALSVVKQLASNIGIAQAPGPSPLTDDNQVQWAMEVICYGLSLPLTEHDALRDCVNIYCDWLSVLHPSPNVSVPRPLSHDPNFYARKIIRHLHNLFIPRKGEGADTIRRQAVLCHRVLRTLQQISQNPESLTHETWEAVLIFLLAINETLLAAPTIKDDVGDQLCERVLSVLFEVWLLACGCWFPPPPLWRTLREMAATWRHRLPLIHHWNRINLALTHKLIAFLFGPNFPVHNYTDEYEQPMPAGLSREAVAQAWFRFVHTLGSPIDLVRPQVISQTPKFLQYAMMSESDPSSHPCLAILPTNFLRAIKGISMQVDAFLGLLSEPLVLSESESKKEPPTPPPHRKPAKSFSVSSTQKGGPKAALISLGSRAMSTSSSSSSSSSLPMMSSSWDVVNPQPLAPDRPKSNSLLHLFGEWLFEAAQVGTGIYSPTVFIREGSGRRTSSLTSTTSEPPEEPSHKYQAGRAMALATLCRIFCSKKTGEQILPVYYARFYLALLQGLKINEKREVDEPLMSILLNCSDLLRLDLDGVQILIPHFLEAIEIVLTDKDLPVSLFYKTSFSQVDLRKSCINLLLSMLVLPLHFSDLTVKELLPSLSCEKTLTCFSQLKPRIMNLLINALQVETDPHNTHMLLGGLLVMVQEAALMEGVNCDSSSLHQGLVHSHSSSSLSSDSVQVLFVRATYLVCHRLISSWKSDLSISLAALELLTGLANTGIADIERVEWERGMKWVCDYIVYQCSRPPQCHIKDLHSSIVAAYSTVSAWVLAQPSLLRPNHCLNHVLQVIELGISGSKSQGKKGEPIKMKDEKELKPVSMRVRDAAEALLTIVLEHAGYFPGPCGAESVSGLVDETVLLKLGNSTQPTTPDPRHAIQYFSLRDSVILAMYEDPLGNYQEPQPIVTVIIRGGFGRHTWSFQLRQLPRHRSTTGRGGRLQGVGGPGRPIYTNPGPSPVQTKHSFFPESIYKIPHCAIDSSLGDLDTVNGWETNSMMGLLRCQSEAEKPSKAVHQSPECIPPKLTAEFNTTRMLLSHFGLLNKSCDGICPVVALESSKEGFFKELELLDKMEPRTCDTCHVFYVRAGQSHYKDILSNVEQSSTVSIHFLQVLRALGWPKVVPNPVPVEIGDKRKLHGGSAYSGHKRVLYWADATSQLTFIVPTVQRLHPPVKQTVTEEKSRKHQTTYPVFVVWLESLEDASHFPLDELIDHTNSGTEGWFSGNCTIIYLHALQSGLFRIKVQPSTNRPTAAALPLVDGIVVSKNLVGSSLRQTALNICRRKRLDNESYQPPHTKRRLKIQDITAKYGLKQPRPDFLTNLFS